MSKVGKFLFIAASLSRHEPKKTDFLWYYYWMTKFDKTMLKQIRTWDYQWMLHQFSERKLSIFPKVNLIQNFGFDESATHTTSGGERLSRLSEEIQLPLSHNSSKNIDRSFYVDYLKNRWADFNRSSLLNQFKENRFKEKKRFTNKLRNVIKRIMPIGFIKRILKIQN
ncbi:MAG: hypothetical protein ACPGO0_04590 [Acidimicrobiales bacterium]